MSTNLNYKQVANVSRRTWDTETYEKRAKARAQNADSSKKKTAEVSGLDQEGQPLIEGDGGTKEEFTPAQKGAAGPHMSKRAFLKARQNKVDVDSKIGSVEIVNPEAAATTKANIAEAGSAKDGVTKTGVGWHCRVCDCFLRDSHTYLDHINGRKHQRNLGYSMRVERSTKDQVSSRLALLATEMKKESVDLVDEEENFHDILKAKDEEAKRRKEERSRKRKERRKLAKIKEREGPTTKEESNEGEEEESEEANAENDNNGGVDPALAAMMGFSGFGGSSKNH